MRLLYQLTTGEKTISLDAGECVMMFKHGEAPITTLILQGLLEVVDENYKHVIKEMLHYVDASGRQVQ